MTGRSESEAIESVLDKAALGLLDRRSALRILAAVGLTAVVGDVAEALAAGENQTKLRASLARAYDYIVVGGGSAGCVVASKLAADRDASVLLIEAGPSDEGVESLARPDIWFTNIGGRFDWNWHYAPQVAANNRDILIPRGKVLGGSGSINAMLWVRGHPADYDQWTALGAKGWDNASTLASFKRIEDWEGGETPLRGTGGPIHIETPKSPHVICEALLEASASLGHPVRSDVNGPEFGGASLANLNIRNGARASTARAYLRPMLGRPNLTVLTDSTVRKLQFDGARCNGVEHAYGGHLLHTKALSEVVLCAGSLATPKLLMLSGIGPADDLLALGIPTRLDHPEVGHNLQDHPLLMGVNFAYVGTAPALRDNGGGAQLIADSGTGASVPDLMIVMIQVPYASPELRRRFPVPQGSFSMTPGLMRTESRGHLRLRSSNPDVAPIIDPNLLATEREQTAIRRGIEICQDLGDQAAFRKICSPASPNKRLSKSELDAFVGDSCSTFFHPVGTCRMGSDPKAVVDAGTLKVCGIERLRVIDASVMPRIPTANTNAATIMIGERGSALITGKI